MNSIEEIFKGKEKISFDKINLKMSSVVYLVYLLETLESKNLKNKNEENRKIHLLAERLKKEFNPKYNKYIKFLEHHNLLIKVANHKAGSNARIYMFPDDLIDSSATHFFIEDKTLLKKVNKNNSGKTESSRVYNRKASRKRPHLTKHFNQYLEIDLDSCVDSMSDMDGFRRHCNYISVFNFHKKYWDFSINEDSDNRLHTLLTRLNKRFLKHISYKKQSLAEVDIKTSQPLFLYAVLNSIFDYEDHSDLKKIIEYKLGKELIQRVQRIKIDRTELAKYGDILMNQDLYDYLANRIDCKKRDNKYVRIEKRKTHPYTIEVLYDTKRDLVKRLVMETLYSSPRNPNKEVKQIKNLFPNIFKIVDFLKSSMEGDKKFPTFIQQIEAEVLLDNIGKSIIEKKPSVVLFSKHDSLITTSKDIDFLEEMIKNQLKEFLRIEKVNVETNHWI